LETELAMPHVRGTLLDGDEVPIVNFDEIVAAVRKVSGLKKSRSYEVGHRLQQQPWVYSTAVPDYGTIDGTLPSSLCNYVKDEPGQPALCRTEAAQHRVALRSKFIEWGHRPPGPGKRERGRPSS
jgi:hypothetical protein